MPVSAEIDKTLLRWYVEIVEKLIFLVCLFIRIAAIIGMGKSRIFLREIKNERD